ncbi:MAG: hypothetical protein IJH35_05600, partial [Methanobrevibacter sp.]|nr:hypothetical protein [Methanobrevibacter sp.]
MMRKNLSIIISLLLIFIVALGAVSANEALDDISVGNDDGSDNLMIDDDSDDWEDDDDSDDWEDD